MGTVPELKSLTSRRLKRTRTKPEIQHQNNPSDQQQNSTAMQQVQQTRNISNVAVNFPFNTIYSECMHSNYSDVQPLRTIC